MLVQGLNMVQRHTRPSQGDPQGGIKNKEASVHVSNVAIVDSNGKPTRVGFKIEGDKKVRVRQDDGRGHQWLIKLTAPRQAGLPGHASATR